MDLSEREQQDSFEYTLETPGGEALDATFIIAGPTHATREAFAKRISRKKLREFNRRGKAQLSEDPDQIERDEIDFACVVTLGWSNIELDGATFTYSEEAARTLYADPRFLWVRQAVVRAAADAENFTGRRSRG